MKNLDPYNLLKRHFDGDISPEENAMLETWYMRYSDPSLETLPDVKRLEQLNKIRNQLVLHSEVIQSNKTQIATTKRFQSPRFLWQFKKLAVAALVLLIGSVGIYYYNGNFKKEHLPDFTVDIAPGKNGAILTLSNGKKIQINDGVAGNIAEESAVSISRNAAGEIIYKVKEDGKSEVQYNTLETSNGQQTQLILPDNSKIWLNAGSVLKYPSSFANLKNRIVELIGEAYFEVAKDSQHPFIVKTSIQQLQVLGTHFNVNNYPNEKLLKTTLIEGSIKVAYGQYDRILIPGEQSSLISDHLHPNVIPKVSDMTVRQADIASVIAWKEGYFRFEEEPLESVMNKISRWYNVEVSYDEGIPKNLVLGGFISRKKNLSTVLEMMTRTEDVKFKMEGNKVKVFKYK